MSSYEVVDLIPCGSCAWINKDRLLEKIPDLDVTFNEHSQSIIINHKDIEINIYEENGVLKVISLHKGQVLYSYDHLGLIQVVKGDSTLRLHMYSEIGEAVYD